MGVLDLEDEHLANAKLVMFTQGIKIDRVQQQLKKFHDPHGA
jgi:hypothetical protein